MKNLFILTISVIISSACFASDVASAKEISDEDRAERKAKMMAMLHKRTGGMVRKAGSGSGLIVVVDTQSKVSPSAVQKPILFVEKRLHLNSAYRKGTLTGMPSLESVKKSGGSVAVFVVDRSDIADPMLVAPESRWAMVNVAALAEDAPVSDLLSKRVSTEVGRAIGYLCGSSNSQYPGTIMSSITEVKSLDVYDGNSEVPLDQFKRIVEYMQGLGVTQFVETTYRKACEQGWAPDPEDEDQKAIWDEYHTIPTKPIKIEFDPKKGR